MYKVEAVYKDNLEPYYCTNHFNLYHHGESCYTVMYISDDLDNILKRYIPSGIMLFNQCDLSNVKLAIIDIFDILSESAGGFYSANQKEATLTNLHYAFSCFKSWCHIHGSLFFRITYEYD